MPLTRLSKITSTIKDALFLSSIVIACLTAVGGATAKIVWPRLIEQLKTELNVATKEDVTALSQRIDQISGEDRIIKMTPGHSYVKEPVSAGSPIELVLAVARTKFGAACRYESGTPLFLDGRGIPFPGRNLPLIKQVGQQAERLPITMEVPLEIEPGRVGVSLSMKYSCPFGVGGSWLTVFEETDLIFFMLDPAP